MAAVSDVPPTVVLPPFLEAALGIGHPWVYRDHVPPRFSAPTGTWVRVCAGKRAAFALWDAESPIALRLYAVEGVPNAAWVEARIRAAWQLREPLRAAGVTAFRWVYGEGDGLPGIVVDLYGEYAVVVAYSDAVLPLVPWVVDALGRMTTLRGVVQRSRAIEERAGGLVLLRGERPPDELTVVEHGIRFQVDLSRGQKTGLFLDHRENRRFLGDIARDRDVLNLFAYTGGFSLYAARGGARHVVSVDVAAPAIAAAAVNFSLNQLPPAHHETIASDVFVFLEQARVEGRRFDLVIADPPSFAKSRAQQRAALRSYVKLHAASLRVLAPQGLYAAASCTAQIDRADFQATLAEAASRCRCRLQILHEAGQPLDHPVAAQHPEGRYLKFVVGRVLPIP
ncbi:MAG: class I SAM-dependent rRNA methyltransferase [Polyangiaceae bacterium]|nr:class I SAM-dependent rRNA methyltransferase [Polyangiaceae bacterium]